MYSIILLVAHTLNFPFLIFQARKEGLHAVLCSNIDLLKEDLAKRAETSAWVVLRRPIRTISALLLVLFPINLVGWASWGITDNPYHEGSGNALRAGDERALPIIGMIAFCTCSFGYLLYKYGQAGAVREQRIALMDPQEKARLLDKIDEDAYREFLEAGGPGP